jgi:hypothetical protein
MSGNIYFDDLFLLSDLNTHIECGWNSLMPSSIICLLVKSQGAYI